MKCINDTFQHFFKRVCQIRIIASYSCLDFMQQPDIRTSFCNSSLPSSLYRTYVVLYATKISIFFCHDDTQFCSLIPRRLFSIQLFLVLPILFRAVGLYVSSRLSSKVKIQPRCLLLINHLVTLRACKPNFMRPCTQDRLLNISIVSEKLWREPRVCVYER